MNRDAYIVIDENVVPLEKPFVTKRPHVDLQWLHTEQEEPLTKNSTPYEVRKRFGSERVGTIEDSNTILVFHNKYYGKGALSGMLVQEDNPELDVWQSHMDVPVDEYRARFTAFAEYLDEVDIERADIGSNMGTAMSMPTFQHTNFRIESMASAPVDIGDIEDVGFQGLFCRNTTGQHVARNLQRAVPRIEHAEKIIVPDSAQVMTQGTVRWQMTDRLAAVLRLEQAAPFYMALHEAWNEAYQGTGVDPQYRCGGIDFGEVQNEAYVAVHAAVQFGRTNTGMIPGLGIALSEPQRATLEEEDDYFMGMMELTRLLTHDEERYEQLQELWRQRQLALER